MSKASTTKKRKSPPVINRAPVSSFKKALREARLRMMVAYANGDREQVMYTTGYVDALVASASLKD
jgi:hypothetical protein